MVPAKHAKRKLFEEDGEEDTQSDSQSDSQSQGDHSQVCSPHFFIHTCHIYSNLCNFFAFLLPLHLPINDCSPMVLMIEMQHSQALINCFDFNASLLKSDGSKGKLGYFADFYFEVL